MISTHCLAGEVHGEVGLRYLADCECFNGSRVEENKNCHIPPLPILNVCCFEFYSKSDRVYLELRQQNMCLVTRVGLRIGKCALKSFAKAERTNFSNLSFLLF